MNSEKINDAVDYEARNKALEEENDKLKLQFTESQRRERLLTRRVHLKEQQIQDYSNQINELKSSVQTPIRSLLDPAVNIIFQKLKNELKATKAKLEETQNELSAWKFTPDSNTGKRLMAKCRLLYQENEELGKMTSNGRLAKLEGDLALHKNFCEELRRSQSEVESIIQDLDVDVEGLTSTIIVLQQELKLKHDRIIAMEAELLSINEPETLKLPAADIPTTTTEKAEDTPEDDEEPPAKKSCPTPEEQ